MEQEKEELKGAKSFGKILSDKEHNKKWLNFAVKELRGHRNRENARHKEAEDYVEDAKLKILSGEGLPDEGIRNIDNYICGFIKKEISAEIKKSLVLVQLPDWEEQDEEGENGDEGNGKNVDENLVVMFEDPFEVRGDRMSSWEVMKKCYEVLEPEDPELLIIFDEKSKGHQNRDIAKYLCVDVREIENLWKRVVRLLRKSIPLFLDL